MVGERWRLPAISEFRTAARVQAVEPAIALPRALANVAMPSEIFVKAQVAVAQAGASGKFEIGQVPAHLVEGWEPFDLI